MSRLATLKSLESRLESFLTGAAGQYDGELNRLGSLNSLEEIAVDSLRGRFINNRLTNWLDKNRDPIKTNQFEKTELTQIANFLEEIKKGLNPEDSGAEAILTDVGQLRDYGVVPKRKIVLTLKRKPEGSGLLKKYIDLLTSEASYLESGEFDDDHLLTILDDVLKSAEAKTDFMYMHLAGSIIYYLKVNGYKVTPFVKRLKEIEDLKLNGD